jgi:putative MATE family efflux protein
MDRAQRLGQAKISTLLWQFTLPAMLVMLAGALYNVIDKIYIGNAVGPLGIAGITIAYPIMMITSAVAGLIGVGGTALVSIRLGQKDIDGAELVIGNALTLTAVISIVLTVLAFIFFNPLLTLFGASQEVLPYAKSYLVIILIGTTFQSISFGMNGFIRAEGHPRKAMVRVITGPILNAILAPIFLFGFGWGMTGAALATVLAQIISAIWVASHFLTGKSTLKIRLKYLWPDWAITWKVFSIGASPFFMQILASLTGVVVNTSAERYGGDVAVSAIGILFSILMLLTLILMGINQGIQPILGFNFGAKKPERVKETLVYALIIATVITSAVWVVILLLPAQIIAFFGSQDTKLIAFGSSAMKVYLFALPAVGVQVLAAGYFQAVGKARTALIISLARQGLIYLPLLVILPPFFAMQGVLLATPISTLAAFLLSGIWLLVDVQRLGGKKPVAQDVSSVVGQQVESKS